MRAMVYTQYGPPEVLRLAEVAKPVPNDNELLIRVRATTVTAGDYRMRGFRVPPVFWLFARLQFGILGPRQPILGIELAGDIEAIGKNVTRFRPGDPVFALAGAGNGAYAEYVCLPQDGTVAHKPANMSYEEAAAVPFGALTALFFLRDKGSIRRGQRVLINGASGGVGTAAVQLARHFGADVTGVCSTANVELVKSLGADQVVDYTQVDFTENGQVYDIIFDAVGNLSVPRCKKVLTPNGIFLALVFGLSHLGHMSWTALTGGQKVIAAVAPDTGITDDLIFLKGVIEAGKYHSVIDRRYPFEQLAEAHRYAERGHKKGNMVVTLDHHDKTRPVGSDIE